MARDPITGRFLEGETRPAIERWAAKVDFRGAGGCWVWTASLTANGYGYFAPDHGPAYKGTRIAHRFAFEHFIGPVRDGLVLDHLCRNRACVNPDHLDPVSQRENLMRGDTIPAKRAAQTHCKHGHEFTADNIYRHPTRGTRHCRACQKSKAKSA